MHHLRLRIDDTEGALYGLRPSSCQEENDVITVLFEFVLYTDEHHLVAFPDRAWSEVKMLI